MPQINMPQRPTAPIEGLLGIVNTVSNLTRNSNENDVNQAKAQELNLSNQQTQIQNQNAQGYLKALSDPTTPQSQSEKAAGLSYLSALRSTNMYKPNSNTGEDALTPLEKIIKDPNTPGLGVQQAFNSPVFKSVTSLGEAKMKGDASMVLAGIRGEAVNNQRDRIAANAADHFDKDPILTKINKQKQQIDLDKHTLENSSTLTPQMLNEVQQGIANAIAGGGSAGLGKTEQIEIQTARQKIAELQQKFTSDPTPVNDPALIQYFHDTLDRLGGAYDRNAYSRAQQIFKGRSQGYKSNPAAISVMQDKVDSYKPSVPDQSPAALKSPPHGQSVIQNGHTYNWNSQTGQYE